MEKVPEDFVRSVPNRGQLSFVMLLKDGVSNAKSALCTLESELEHLAHSADRVKVIDEHGYFLGCLKYVEVL
jgi:hypothetical protein